jgi:uncharacterized protein (DUF1778 family)
MQNKESKTKINKSLTETDFSKTSSEELKKGSASSKPPQKMGRPARKESSPVTWSIRGVFPDTRLVIEKAAERSGKTIGQFINEDIREFTQSLLTKAAQPPTAPKDIQDQINHLTQMIEGIANRLPEQGKKSFWKRVFG